MNAHLGRARSGLSGWLARVFAGPEIHALEMACSERDARVAAIESELDTARSSITRAREEATANSRDMEKLTAALAKMGAEVVDLNTRLDHARASAEVSHRLAGELEAKAKTLASAVSRSAAAGAPERRILELEDAVRRATADLVARDASIRELERRLVEALADRPEHRARSERDALLEELEATVRELRSVVDQHGAPP